VTEPGAETPDQDASRARIEAGLAELERRLLVLERSSNAPGEGIEAILSEVEVFREGVRDLAADVAELRDQVAALVSTCERILAGAGGPDRRLTVETRRGRRTGSSAIPRVAARVVRSGVGAARRLLRPDQGGAVARMDLEVDLADRPAESVPSLALVVPVTRVDESVAPPPGLVGQSEVELEIVLWDRDRGAAVIHRAGQPPVDHHADDQRTLADAIGSDFVVVVPPSITLMPTTIELCRWALASEQLPLVLAVPEGSGDRRRFFEITPRAEWRNATAPEGRRAAVVHAKLVGATETGASVDMPLTFAGKGCARAAGRYLVSPHKTGRVRHPVRPIARLVATRRDHGQSPILVLASLADGVDRLLMWMLTECFDDRDVTVFLTWAGEVNPAGRLRALAEGAHRLYPIDGFLDSSVWPSLIAERITADGVGAVFRIGRQPDVPAAARESVRVVDLLLDPAEVAATSDADRVIAVGRDGAEAARSDDRPVVLANPIPPLPKQPPAPNWVAAVRQALGLEEDHRLVVMESDLTPTQRPEDFVAVAHRLRDRRDLHFRLIGAGPLSGTVCDLAHYFGLERFALVPPTYTPVNLAAAAEIIVSTAERHPWPLMPAYALACGRALVATDVDNVRELVEQAEGDRSALVRPGDLDGLTAAVNAAADSKGRPRITKKAWRAGSSRAAASRAAFETALWGTTAGRDKDA
jgi:glycosyltransferase involved in cell wall biosynthesis